MLRLVSGDRRVRWGGMAGTRTEDLVGRREQVARSKQRAGRVLTGIGIVLVSIAVLLLVVAAVLTTAAAALEESGRYDSADSLETAAVLMVTVPPAALLLFGMCALIPGEQLRRGGIGRNPTPPPTALPSASYVSQFRVLSTGWHLTWIVVGAVVSLTLIGVPMVSWFTGSWPANLSDDSSFAGFWTIYGSLGFGVVVATVVSLIKKLGYRRAIARGRTNVSPAPGRRFWRWVDYRWRFDLWSAGVGGVLIALSPTFIAIDVGPDSNGFVPAGDLVPTLAMLIGGMVLVVVGIIAALNFWRSGEKLGSGESVS